MDTKKEMVIIDDRIVTGEVSECDYDATSRTYKIKYKNNYKTYSFSPVRVKYLTNPRLLETQESYFLVDNKILQNIKEIYDFNYFETHYYHVIFNDNKTANYIDNKLKIVGRFSDDILRYLKQVAQITSLNTEEGERLLCKQMEKIEVDNIEDALANYLKLSGNISKNNSNELLIFPFGCNSSQYEAVENAIYNKISVIEGPPGTGKTQTILNIIANIIIRNMNCQVVSNNNAAIENIEEKLKEKDLDYIQALLGRRYNKDLFIENQKEELPDFSEYEEMDTEELSTVVKSNNKIVREVYKNRREKAILIQKKKSLELEYKYFKELVKSQNIELLELKKYNPNKIKLLWNEMISLEKISLWNLIKYVFIYKVENFKFYKNDMNVVIKSLENEIYQNDMKELEEQIKKCESFDESNKDRETEFIECSLYYFKKYLSLKYKSPRKKYTESEIWKKPRDFLNDYPIVLSTTYSSRNTFNNDFKFDYIIMDESSQIDVVTGTLALSSAKYAVIIGDEKQLPNVVPNNIKEETDKIFKEYKIDKCYSYSLNSFLSSVKSAIPNVQDKLLVEHYRCNPKIINFCNQKFYNNQLVIMTKDKENKEKIDEKDIIKVIKTNKGNHSREKASQRQVDIIKEILENNKKDVGIIAPYNAQVDLIKENIKDTATEVSTVHKFQGREKDTIIISTVEDEISDFVGDAKILNVAISRAKNQLYFIVTGNEIKNSNIRDFLDYVEYNNMEIVNSKIYSSFDLLYKQYELERLEFFKKHNRIGKFDSENIIYYLIQDIINDYEGLEFHFHQSLNDLINDKSLLDEKERKYASHHNTHIDFYIFKKIGDKPILAIEVDGYKNHKKGTKQYERDQLKNSILEKYNIPLIRLKTNGSGEEKKIRSKLEEITKK